MFRRELPTRVEASKAAGAFPIYRKHALGNYTTYTRIDQDLRAISITPDKKGKLYSLEIEDEYVFDSSPEDYHLGRGAYESSAEEFQSVLKSLKVAIGSLGQG